MRKYFYFLVASLIAIVMSTSLTYSQFGLGNPTISVTLKHAPAYQMQIKTIAFGEPRGKGGNEIVSKLTEIFVNNNVNVVDRMNLDRIMSEHKLNMSGFVDQSNIAKIGQFVGADALFIITSTRYGEQAPRYSSKRFNKDSKDAFTEYYCEVQANVAFSFQTVDLKTGRILKAFNVNEVARKMETSREGQPAPPPAYEALDDAIGRASVAVSRLFFPWTENANLIFFDDKDYNLKTAYNFFRSNQFDSALTASKESLALAEADPKPKQKQMRHAIYNVAMCLFAMDDSENALPLFQRAVATNGGAHETAALQQCQKALELKKSFQEYETKASLGLVLGSSPSADQNNAPSVPPNADQNKAPSLPPSADQNNAPSVPPNATDGSMAQKLVSTPTSPAKPALSPEERLLKLNELFKKGILNQKEYDAKKAEILKEL